MCETRIAETVTLAQSPGHARDAFSFAPRNQGACDDQALAEALIGSGFFNPS